LSFTRRPQEGFKNFEKKTTAGRKGGGGGGGGGGGTDRLGLIDI